MLIELSTVKKPTRHAYEMIGVYFTDLADEEQLMTHSEKYKSREA